MISCGGGYFQAEDDINCEEYGKQLNLERHVDILIVFEGNMDYAITYVKVRKNLAV